MNSTIFQASDLASKRREVLDTAREGRAVVRDTDGTGLVMLPKAELEAIEGYANWSVKHRRLENLLRRDGVPTVEELGEFAWLRFFDPEDQLAFCDDLFTALMVSFSNQDTTEIDQTVKEWQITARQLSDPVRRSVLLGMGNADDFVPAPKPQE